eukprot:SAG31_NODE_607_length_13606_cov_11.366699_8_plen_88_part_00
MWLGTDYDDDYYRLVWDSEMQPGLAAAGQSTYDVTIQEREVMQEAWPIPESTPKKRTVEALKVVCYVMRAVWLNSSIPLGLLSNVLM